MAEESFESFEEALGEGDWGLIFDKDGGLKGLFIPSGQEDDLVPESIVEICEQYFGVDLNTDVEQITLH